VVAEFADGESSSITTAGQPQPPVPQLKVLFPVEATAASCRPNEPPTVGQLWNTISSRLLSEGFIKSQAPPGQTTATSLELVAWLLCVISMGSPPPVVAEVVPLMLSTPLYSATAMNKDESAHELSKFTVKLVDEVPANTAQTSTFSNTLSIETIFVKVSDAVFVTLDTKGSVSRHT
jgi:hypothetical protein